MLKKEKPRDHIACELHTLKNIASCRCTVIYICCRGTLSCLWCTEAHAQKRITNMNRQELKACNLAMPLCEHDYKCTKTHGVAKIQTNDYKIFTHYSYTMSILELNNYIGLANIVYCATQWCGGWHCHITARFSGQFPVCGLYVITVSSLVLGGYSGFHP